MTYSCVIKVSSKSKKRKFLSTDSLIDPIKLNTHLKFNEARKLAKKVANGQQIEFVLRDRNDAEAAFAFAEEVRSLGFSSSVEYMVMGADLPYLVNATGKIQGSEKLAERELSAEDIEILISNPSTQMVVTGFGYQMEWIPKKEMHKFWNQSVQPQLIDSQNSQKRNDYPLYEAIEWVAKSGKSYIVLWTYH